MRSTASVSVTHPRDALAQRVASRVLARARVARDVEIDGLTFAEALKIVGLAPGARELRDEYEFQKYLSRNFWSREPAISAAEEEKVRRAEVRIVDELRYPERGDRLDAFDLLRAEAKPLGKSCFWIPPHNLAVRANTFVTTLTQFSVLPTAARPYVAATSYSPEALHLDFRWQNVQYAGQIQLPMSLKWVERYIASMKRAPDIKESVRQELREIETKFKTQIPSSVESAIVARAEKLAKRRIDMESFNTDERWPLNGDKPGKHASYFYDRGSAV